jgi:hypothetical protein
MPIQTVPLSELFSIILISTLFSSVGECQPVFFGLILPFRLCFTIPDVSIPAVLISYPPLSHSYIDMLTIFFFQFYVVTKYFYF